MESLAFYVIVISPSCAISDCPCGHNEMDIVDTDGFLNLCESPCAFSNNFSVLLLVHRWGIGKAFLLLLLELLQRSMKEKENKSTRHKQPYNKQ